MKCLHLKAFGYLVDHKRGMKDSVYVYMQPNNVLVFKLMTQLDWKPSCQHLSQSDQSEFDPN